MLQKLKERYHISRMIRNAINTYPDFLLKAMVKDSLINCRNSVNDLDAITALKYTYKGVSGLGEGETSIPQQYRQAHNSQLGRIDIDAVSSTDPGLTGIVCPMAKTHNGSFSEDEEPNTWREEVDQILSEYRDLMGLQQLLLMKERITDLSDEDKSRKDTIEDSMRSMDSLMKPISSIEQSKPELIPLILGEVTSK